MRPPRPLNIKSENFQLINSIASIGVTHDVRKNAIRVNNEFKAKYGLENVSFHIDLNYSRPLVKSDSWRNDTKVASIINEIIRDIYETLVF